MTGHWGVKSYENDGAADAIDAGMERVHGATYDDLMDDANPLPFDQVQQTMANPETLAASFEALQETVGADHPFADWDDDERLAYAGLIVRHAEFGVPVPADWLDRAIDWLETEAIDWDDESTVRRLRREKEVALLQSLKGPTQTQGGDDS